MAYYSSTENQLAIGLRSGQCDRYVLQQSLVDTFLGLSTEETVCRQEVANFTSFVDKSVDRREDTALALLLNLSDNH